MGLAGIAPWTVLAGYAVFVYALAPRRVGATEFFSGAAPSGEAPGLWLLVASAAVSWIFAKSVANAAGLGQAYGLAGAGGYAVYYASFVVAGIAIYFIRTRGGHASLAAFLAAKYGPWCARLFLLAVAIRLLNEVWSNTKVGALYFGPEGSLGYWLAAGAITAFTAAYTWKGGLRSSLVTDMGQMALAALLLGLVLIAVLPPVLDRPPAPVGAPAHAAGLTFAALAAVQILSYPFHDPVLTDRAFITRPAVMLKGFLLAAVLGGGFILLFGTVGLYARAAGLSGDAVLSVPVTLGLPGLLVFNALMLASAGSTLDSTFASTAKLVARDWRRAGEATSIRERALGRVALLGIAVLGNLPLLALYLPGGAGPAIIAATTISGTMVMGLAPIFLLGFVPGAGRLSFHLAFWPGLALGGIKAAEGALAAPLLPRWTSLGSGPFADDLGVNLMGLGVCTLGFLAGALLSGRRRRVLAGAPLPRP